LDQSDAPLVTRDISWPESDTDNQLFSRRKTLRRIIVMIDADLLTDERLYPSGGPDRLEQLHLLADLLGHELVSTYRYADDGPPVELQPVLLQGNVPCYPGWIVIDHQQATENGWPVRYSKNANSYTEAAILGNGVMIAENDVNADAYQDLSVDEARKRRRADALAAQAANQSLGADVYITERKYLVGRKSFLTRGTTICTPEESIALVSLYLRTQGEYTVQSHFTFNRGLFFWVGTRELLPAAWRWSSASVQHWQGSGDNSLPLLAGSLLQRFDRALEQRDHVHVSLNQKQNNDVREDALSDLDNILVLLMGAIDLAARMAHRILGVAGDEYRAGWQNQRWLKRVAQLHPTLAAVVNPGSSNLHALTIVRLLRNSVHGAALQGLAYVEGSGPQETLVGLPPQDEADLLQAMDALGGRTSWGVRQNIPGRTVVDPGLVVERLFEVIPPLLNELMEETPVQRLPHVQPAILSGLPPTGGSSPFEPWMRQSIRWQLGL